MGRAWMPLYVGDYLRDTRDLNTLQHGAYLMLIMHYWQHGALPQDEARLAAIAGLSVAQWRRIRAPVEAKFAAGWRHKRIDAEIAKMDRALAQRRLAGRSGGIRSGIARAVAQGEAIIRGQAQGKRALARRPGAGEADAPAGMQQPASNHNHIIESSLSSGVSGDRAAAPAKPANQWSRQELDALFAGRAATPAQSKSETGE